MTTQTAADLRAAADVLERDRWTQGVSHRYDEESDTDYWCMVGAFRQVVMGDARRYAYGYHALYAGLGQSPAAWNDAPGRTADEVIAALRAAADHAAADRAEQESGR